MTRLTAALILFISSVFGQGPAKPEFEVASVRIVPPTETGVVLDSYMPTLDIPPGATLRISNRRLDEIIMLAYDVGVRQISGPRWLIEPTTDPTAVSRFEIIAKVPDNAKKEQIPLMLQRLLEDRFRLQVHREPRPTQIYSLEVGKSGSKLQPTMANSSKAPGCARTIAETGVAADCYNVTATQLAQQLQSLGPAYFREGPIVDNTGLKGAFDLRLEWLMQGQLDAGMTGPNLYEAVEKHGLKLEKKRDTADMLIVDRVEQVPTEN